MFLLYNSLVELVVWAILCPYELVLLALGRREREVLRQRLGCIAASSPGRGPLILVHAVSVGEMAAADALVAALTRAVPSARFVITTGNEAGLAAARGLARRCSRIQGVSRLPWDRAKALRRWLSRLQPAMCVVVETEIWPNLFRACGELDIALCVANGRIYSGDLWRYRLLRGFFRRALAHVAWLGVQDESERRRFEMLGADASRIHVLGNLKYDTPLPRAEPRAASRLGAPGGVVLAASTHPREEALILDAFVRSGAVEDGVRCVLAPRHPARAASIRRLARARALRAVLWSEGSTADPAATVLIVDEIGVLPGLFEFADLVIVGGSLAPRGGHNLLEPASHGRVIVVGPHVDHFRSIVDDFVERRALIQLPSADGLDVILRELLADEDRRRELGRRARAAFEAGRGTAMAHARALAALLEGASASG